MIKVGMRQDDRIDLLRLEGKYLVLYPFYGITTLVHPAIEEYSGTSQGFQQVTGTGNLLSSTEKCQGSHGIGANRGLTDLFIIPGRRQGLSGNPAGMAYQPVGDTERKHHSGNCEHVD